MSKSCPLYGVAISQDCVECDTKDCRTMNKKKYKEICIGIDQSYKNCGISVSADGRLLKVSHVDLNIYDTNSLKRFVLKEKLKPIIVKMLDKADKVICVIERIRLQSRGFVNINYIKSIGALNALIVDICSKYDVQVYSVDTRCWKSQVVGTSKPQVNSYGVPTEKWPTVHWVNKQGFKNSILRKVKGRKKKGTFIGANDIRYQFDNDAADSAAISMFWFVGDRDKLKEEH